MCPNRTNQQENESLPTGSGHTGSNTRVAREWFDALEKGDVRIDDADTLRVRSMVSGLAAHVLPEVFEALMACDICVAPFTLYNATPVRRVDGRLVLVVYEGLLDAITASLELSHAISGLPPALDAVAPRHDCPDISARAWAAVLLAELTRRFCKHDRARPNFGPLVPKERVCDIRVGLGCAVLWTLLHELGHVRLNHLDMRAIERLRVPEVEDFLVAETMTLMHQAELDADFEAYRCLSPSGRPLCLAWMRIALAPQMMFDSLTVQRSGTHPLSVNRLGQVLVRMSETGQLVLADGTRDSLENHAATLASIESEYLKAGDNQTATGISRLEDRSLAILINGLSPIFNNEGIPLNRVLAVPELGWRDYVRLESDGLS